MVSLKQKALQAIAEEKHFKSFSDLEKDLGNLLARDIEIDTDQTLRVVCEFAQQKQKEAEKEANKHFEAVKIANRTDNHLEKQINLTKEAKADGKLEAYKELLMELKK